MTLIHTSTQTLKQSQWLSSGLPICLLIPLLWDNAAPSLMTLQKSKGLSLEAKDATPEAEGEVKLTKSAETAVVISA